LGKKARGGGAPPSSGRRRTGSATLRSVEISDLFKELG
jgi:hypothetical protein